MESQFVEGVAADVTVGTAEGARASLVVMSTHGHGGLGRWLYGSVADEVLQEICGLIDEGGHVSKTLVEVDAA